MPAFTSSPRVRTTALARAVAPLLLILAMLAGACASTATVTLTTDGEAAAAAAPAGERGTRASTSGDGATAEGAGAVATDADGNEIANEVAGVSFEATPQFLAYAAEQVETASSYRMEMFQDFDGGDLMSFGSRDSAFMTGAINGDLAEIEIDMGTMFEDIPMLAGELDGDLSMRMIVDGTTMYMNAPFFGTLQGMDPSMGSMPALDVISDGWGRIDVATLAGDDVAASLESLNMGAATDSEAVLSILEAAGEVLDGGRSEVRGIATNRVYTSASFDDLMEAAGGAGADLGDIPQDFFDDMPPVGIEVHIDDANRVRRVEYLMDMGSMMAELGLEMKLWQRIDYFSFDEAIDVAVPVGAVDITDDFAALAEYGG